MAGMTRIDRIRKSITLHNLESMIQSGMPGYRITIYTKEYRQLFCGNSGRLSHTLKDTEMVYVQRIHVTRITIRNICQNGTQSRKG
jgi:hypothetical protein